MLKYKKESHWERGVFLLDGQQISYKEVEYMFNELTKDKRQLESMLQLETAEYNQMRDKHHDLLGLKVNVNE